MMKIIAFILSIYIFGLSLAPCEDAGALDNKVKTEISQAIDDGDQHQETDLCPPFCNCNCCHVHPTNFDIADYRIVSTAISMETFYCFVGVEKDFNNSILQPPQV